jgi:hypothetical protein
MNKYECTGVDHTVIYKLLKHNKAVPLWQTQFVAHAFSW